MAHDDRVVKSTRLRPIVVLEAVVLAGWLADRLAGPCRLRGKRSLSMKMENRFHTAIARENNTIAPAAAAAATHTIAEFPPFAVRDIAAMIWWITHECRDCFFYRTHGTVRPWGWFKSLRTIVQNVLPIYLILKWSTNCCHYKACCHKHYKCLVLVTFL